MAMTPTEYKAAEKSRNRNITTTTTKLQNKKTTCQQSDDK